MNGLHDPGRRRFLRLSATLGAGLAIGLPLAGCREEEQAGAKAQDTASRLGRWVEILDDGRIVLFIADAEMGQGVDTGLGKLLAEGLDADWAAVEVRQAPVRPEYGPRITGGSSSIREAWGELQQIGAAARWMLVQTAAERWGLPPERLTTRAGAVLHPDGRRITYAELAQAAAARPVPGSPPLPPYHEDGLIGRRVPPAGIRARVTGGLRHAADIRLPGMVHATVLHPPRPGLKPTAMNRAAALAIPGTLDVFEIEEGIAVVAEHTWAAFRAARALEPVWPADRLDDAAILEQFRTDARRSGVTWIDEGAPPEDTSGLRRVTAEYALPFQAHAPMEPMCCTVRIHEDRRCEIWAPTQSATAARRVAAGHLHSRLRRLADKLRTRLDGAYDPLADIELHVTPIGGAFGRRLQNDYVSEAVQIALRIGRPVQLQWRREEDFLADRLRPASLQRLSALLDADGEVLSFEHLVVAPSINESLWPGSKPDGRDSSAVQGARHLPYTFAHRRLRYVMSNTPMRLGFWRSVGHSYTCWAIERFVDRLAAGAGVDPLRWRLDHLPPGDGARRCLEALGDSAPPEGTEAVGYAIMNAYESSIATRVAVRREGDGWRILRIDNVVDCGRVIDPLQAERQIQGGIIFGLTAIMKSRVHIRDGAVAERNFDRFPLLRLRETPEIRVRFLDGERDPGGIGELGTPTVGPALANALTALGLDPDRLLLAGLEA